MNPLQEKLLTMLEWFHQYCEKNKITYYICCGTLLGAVRHGGFIPWDDDLDVLVPRPDYDRLISLFTKQEDKYILESPFSGNEDYLYTYTKLYDTTTIAVEHTAIPCKRGVFLDIFPLDGIGNSPEESLKNYKKLELKSKFLHCRNYKVKKGRMSLRNVIIFLTHLIPGINNKKLSMKVARSYAEIDYERSSWVGNLICGTNEIHEKALLGKPTLYTFENIRVYGPEQYEAYLTKLYGEWRQPPPVEHRTGHSFAILDLNRSYLDPEK